MSKKTVEIQAVNTIYHNGRKIDPGGVFPCEKKEAERLIGLGAARIPAPEQPQEPQAKTQPLTVEILRADYPDLVARIEAEARQGYISQEEASKDFDALRKELDEARAALEKAAAKKQ